MIVYLKKKATDENLFVFYDLQRIYNCNFGNSRILTIDHSNFFGTEIENTSFWGLNYLALVFTGERFNKVNFKVRNIQFCDF